MTPDLINAVFELSGGFIILLNIRRILIDKMLRGFDWRVAGFFSAWGYWNLFYYPHLDQWLSTAAALILALTNTVYTALAIYYTKKGN